jgi:hypothetical protein
VKNRFSIGDKVRLMDEAAEGEISAIISDKLVEIRDENGFEYTVNINKIVPLFDTKKISGTEEAGTQQEVIPQSKSESFLSFFNNAESLFLCAVPENFDALLNTSYKVYLVNLCEEIILYSLQQANATQEASAYGVLNAGEETFIGTFSAGKKLSAVQLQLKCILHADESKIMERQFSFSAEDFTNEKRFHSHELFRKHILSFDCLAASEIKISEGDITKLADYFSSPERRVSVKEERRGGKASGESPLLTNEKTVDLHIEELTDDYNHMSNAEIITLQLNHFRRELDSAILNHYYRIIFIHGKGNGVLKGHIRNELDAMKLRHRDADTGKFGFGATEVLL